MVVVEKMSLSNERKLRCPSGGGKFGGYIPVSLSGEVSLHFGSFATAIFLYDIVNFVT